MQMWEVPGGKRQKHIKTYPSSKLKSFCWLSLSCFFGKNNFCERRSLFPICLVSNLDKKVSFESLEVGHISSSTFKGD